MAAHRRLSQVEAAHSVQPVGHLSLLQAARCLNRATHPRDQSTAGQVFRGYLMGFVRALLLAAVMVVSVPVANRPADAAGFDCKRAKSLVEKQICGVPEFSKQDGEIAALYTRTLAALSK